MLSTQAERQDLIKRLLGAETTGEIGHWFGELTTRREALSEQELALLLPLFVKPSFSDYGRKRLISLLGKHINVAVKGLDDPSKEIRLACLTCLTSVRKQDLSKVRACADRVRQLRDDEDSAVRVEADRLYKRLAAMDDDDFRPKSRRKRGWFSF